LLKLVHANLHGQEKVLTFLDSGGLLGGVLTGLRKRTLATLGGGNVNRGRLGLDGVGVDRSQRTGVHLGGI
jgi:hypothetical protein